MFVPEKRVKYEKMLYKFIKGILLVYHETTIRVNGAWIKTY